MCAKYSFDTGFFPKNTGLTADDVNRRLFQPAEIPIVMPGEPKPKGIYFVRIRAADKGRKSARAYLYRPDGGRASLKIDVGPDGWRERVVARAREVIDEEHRDETTRIAPQLIKTCDLLVEAVAAAEERAADGDITEGSLRAYRGCAKRLGEWLKESTVDKIKPSTPGKYMAWARRRGLAYNVAVDDLTFLRRGLNEALTRRLAPYRVWFVVPERQSAVKSPFTPWELDRVFAACLGHRFTDAGALEMVVDPETGETRPFRHSPEEIARRAPYFVAIHIAVATGRASRRSARCRGSISEAPGSTWRAASCTVRARRRSGSRSSVAANASCRRRWSRSCCRSPRRTSAPAAFGSSTTPTASACRGAAVENLGGDPEGRLRQPPAVPFDHRHRRPGRETWACADRRAVRVLPDDGAHAGEVRR
jgi:hypothetical protein